MRLLHAAAFAALALSMTAPALAQSEEDVHAALVTIFGADEAENFNSIYETLVFNIGDAELISEMGSYPFEVAANGELYDILEPADFVDNFDALVMPETIEAVAGTDYADLIVTDEGVGFGNGAVWVNLVCLDDACSAANWGITRINN